ncbi:MAG: ribokinase [Candidatus Aminicenantes bacterium]|nr:ribokinase [Candidatus Aminicenantes bacterium]
MDRPKIVVVGSSNTDLIVRADRIPRPGETVLGGTFHVASGGKGANQAVAAARLGGTVTLVARLGTDEFGERALAGLKAEGVDVSRIRRDPKAASGVALILVNREGENSIAVASGVNARLSPADVRGASAEIASARAVLLQLETPLPTVRTAARLAAANDVLVVLNPAPARPLDAVLLRLVDVLTPNETEAEFLTGIAVRSRRDMAEAARRLRQRGPKAVLITLGAKGVFVSAEGTEVWLPAFAVKAVDTTAAGDVFNGALAVALADGQTLLEAARFANGAAALSVTKLGAQPSAPARREVELFLKSAARRGGI